MLPVPRGYSLMHFNGIKFFLIETDRAIKIQVTRIFKHGLERVEDATSIRSMCLPKYDGVMSHLLRVLHSIQECWGRSPLFPTSHSSFRIESRVDFIDLSFVKYIAAFFAIINFQIKMQLNCNNLIIMKKNPLFYAYQNINLKILKLKSFLVECGIFDVHLQLEK